MPTTFSRTLRSLESVPFMHMEILRRRSKTDFLLMLPMNEALTGGARLSYIVSVFRRPSGGKANSIGLATNGHARAGRSGATKFGRDSRPPRAVPLRAVRSLVTLDGATSSVSSSKTRRLN